MNILAFNEINQVSGGTNWNDERKLDPTEWLTSGIVGGGCGAAVFTISMFSANPLAFSTCFLVGYGIGFAERAAENMVAYYGYYLDKPRDNNY